MDALWAAAASDLGAFLDHWFFFALVGVMAAGLGGAVGKGAGFPNLFRDDRRLFDPAAGGALARLWASPAFWSHVGLTLLFAGALLIARDAPGCAPRCAWGPGAEARLLGYGGAAAALFLLLGWRATRATRVDGSKPPWRDVRIEMYRRILGAAAGLAAAWLAWVAAEAIPADLGALLPAGWGAAWSPHLPWIYVFAIAGVAATLGPRQILPCLSLTALLAVLILVGGAMARLSGGWAEAATLGLILWIAYANGARFKLRIPGFPDPSGDAPDATEYDRPASELISPNMRVSAPTHEGAIAPTAALDAWLARARAEKGPDHFAAQSGPGGRYEGLNGAIRLVTGASGGMVAGAYFVALAAEGRATPVTEALEADILAFQQTSPEGRRSIPIPRDSLTPVARRMVRRDLPAILSRRRPSTDRGRALEDQWTTLHRSFAEIAAAEREGRAPSIILSPMLIESGAPAFLSNLDLSALRERSLGFDERHVDLDKESVELFNPFPNAWDALTLATAVRLNATFPYVSPAVSLPTIPRRRVVDAGYYDNYGVDLATAYLLTPAVKSWIQENCSGVAVLQARAFPSGLPDAPQSAPARAFQWLTSPLEGVFKARSSSQMFRNNQQLRLVSSIYDVEMQQDFVQSFAFEAAADASMSWYLPEDEFCALRNLLPDRDATVAAAETADEDKVAMVARQQTKLERQLDALAAFWAQ